MGLRTRLLFLVLLAVIPGLLLSVLTHVEQERAGRDRVAKDASRVAQLAAANQLALVDATRQHLEALARFPQARGHDLAAFEMFFASMKKVYTNYTDFGLIETNGNLVACSFAGKGGSNLAGRTDFQRVLATRSFAVGDYQASTGGMKPSLLFAHPVVDEKNRLARVIYAALDLDVLNAAATKAQLPEAGVIEIFDSNRNILAHFPGSENWIGRTEASPSFAERVMASEEGTVEARWFDNVKRLCAFTTVRNGRSPGLFVVVGIPTDLAFGRTKRAMVRNLIVLSAVALLALLAAWIYASSRILDPVKALVGVTRRLAGGDLSVRTGMAGTSGEFSQLTEAFDEMAASLQRQRMEIEKSDKEIRLLNAGLEQRVAERTRLLEQANAELEAFSTSVSHDLRAPLRHISGYAEFLHEDFAPVLGESGGRTLDQIRKAVAQMGMLIEDLLSFSRMSRSEMHKRPVKMDELAREVIAEMEADIRGRNIEWQVDMLPEVPVDRSLLKQVWTNLIGNAVKYTRQREPARIQIQCARNGGTDWVFSVRDNGAGFRMEYADKLFGVFQRLHAEHEFEGTGLGLANVRRIIHRHGGKTWAEGEVNKGATFYFTLPG